MIDPKKDTRAARGGFTLIELLVVVVVMGLLAAIALPRFRKVAEEAYKSSVIADVRNMAAKQELFHNIHLRYGTMAELDDYLESDGVTVTLSDVSNTGFAVTASHQALPGYMCAYFMGDAPAPAPATLPAQIRCQ